MIVKENLYRWSMVDPRKSQDYQKQDARTIHFPVRSRKDEAVMRYTVRYAW